MNPVPPMTSSRGISGSKIMFSQMGGYEHRRQFLILSLDRAAKVGPPGPVYLNLEGAELIEGALRLDTRPLENRLDRFHTLRSNSVSRPSMMTQSSLLAPIIAATIETQG
jgi:hypothetical protein